MAQLKPKPGETGGEFTRRVAEARKPKPKPKKKPAAKATEKDE